MFGLSNDYYFYHFETNSTYYLYSGIFFAVRVCRWRSVNDARPPAPQKSIECPWTVAEKFKRSRTYFFKVRKVYEKVRIEQHLKKDRSSKGERV